MFLLTLKYSDKNKSDRVKHRQNAIIENIVKSTTHLNNFAKL